jgi:hypothetical protein
VFRVGLEDFVVNTLSKLPSLWERLRYVAELRSPSREHAHWGLEQVYGPEATQDILADAHQSLFTLALTTSLQKLLEESPTSDFSTLRAMCPALTPEGASHASVLHLALVLDYLATLAATNSISRA